VAQQQMMRGRDRLTRVGVPRSVLAGRVPQEGRAPRLVQRRPDPHPVSQDAVHERGELREPERGVTRQPAAGQMGGKVPVVERQPGVDARLQQGVHQPRIEVEASRVGRAVGPQDAGPAHRESVGVQPEPGHPGDVLAVAVIVVHRHVGVLPARDGTRDCAEVVPDGRGAAPGPGGTLDLVGRRGGAPAETRGESDHGHPLTAPCMIPETRWRPATMNSNSSGNVANTTPAMIKDMSLK